MFERQIVAVGLLTKHELKLLGQGFSRAWPIDATPCFEGLLLAIDEAERDLWRETLRTIRLRTGKIPLLAGKQEAELIGVRVGRRKEMAPPAFGT
jgi:hypothetical protein